MELMDSIKAGGFTPTEYTGTFADDLLRIALDIGEGLLKSGAEVRRVEYTVEKICRSYGAVHAEVFTIHSLILASVRMEDGSYSAQPRRIIEITNNMSELEAYNALSRKLCAETPDFDEADRLIREVKEKKRYPKWMTFIGYIAASSSFAVFFGGTLLDGAAAAFIGAVLYFVDRVKFDYFNQMVKTLLTAFFAGILACLTVRIGCADNLDTVIIGSMMLMIPGLSLGNAMRDLLCGDTLAGTLKTVQAIILATMIAIGYALSVVIAGGGL